MKQLLLILMLAIAITTAGWYPLPFRMGIPKNETTTSLNTILWNGEPVAWNISSYGWNKSTGMINAVEMDGYRYKFQPGTDDCYGTMNRTKLNKTVNWSVNDPKNLAFSCYAPIINAFQDQVIKITGIPPTQTIVELPYSYEITIIKGNRESVQYLTGNCLKLYEHIFPNAFWLFDNKSKTFKISPRFS